jgi:hypothetical protein
MTDWNKAAADLAAEFAANPESAQEGDSLPADWGLDMHVAYVAKKCGLNAVPTFLRNFCAKETCETVEDASQQLRKRNLSRVADVLEEFIGNLPSEVEAEINRPQPEHYDDKAWAGKQGWHVSEWVRRRMKISGESWNELVRRHDLEEWAELIRPDVLCQDGRWFVMGENGRLMGASGVPNALFVTRESPSPTRQ